NPCGFLRRTTARVFNRPGCSSCGSAVAAEPGAEISSPSTVIAPSVTPGSTYSTPSSTTTVPSNVPLPPDNPTLPEKAPSAGPGRSLVPNTGSTANPGARPTSYFGRPSTTRTAVRLDSGPATQRDSTVRPARESSRPAATPRTTNEEDNPLDHLPPL